MSPRLSILSVNYNCAATLSECVASCHAHTSVPMEFIAVDNASSPQQLEQFRKLPGIVAKELLRNVGFGRANNEAASIAQGEYLAILNPDTVLHEDTLSRLVDHLESHPECGLCGPMLVDESGTEQMTWNVPETLLWEFIKGHYLQGTWRRFLLARFRRRHGNAHWPVGFVLGACMVIRRSLFLDLGGFDPDFFMNGEDVELCDRIRERGLQIHYRHDLRLLHAEGTTQRADWERYMFHRFQAFRIYIDKRYQGLRRNIAILLWYEAIALRILSGFLLLRGTSRTRLRGYLKAVKAWRETPNGQYTA